MAIKVFVGDADTVETATNQFMEDKGKDFPVRTNTEIVEGQLVYIATVFYDGKPKQPSNKQFNQTGELVEDVKPTTSQNKIGALWKRGKVYSGTIEINGEKEPLVFSDQMWNNMKTVDTKSGDKMKLGQLPTSFDNGFIKFRIIVNQYKSKENQPDFIIMRAD